MTDQKQKKNVEYFNCLGSIVENDARPTREIKSRISTEKVAFNKKYVFTRILDLKSREKANEILRFENNFVWC